MSARVVRRTALACLALLLAASAAHAAQKQAAPKKPEQIIACTGRFAKSVTHASLVKAFGTRNVAVQSVGTGEGETVTASVIFARDVARRFMMREGADNAAIYGEERSFMSDDNGMRKAAPVVDAVGLRYGE